MKTETLTKTESQGSCAKDCGTLGLSQLLAENLSPARETPESSLETAGDTWLLSSLRKKLEGVCEPPALAPRVIRMLLGTLLGDGSIGYPPKCVHPRYRANHGLPQKAYCWSKYQVIKSLVNKEPVEKPNGGWGDTSVIFTTRVSRDLDFLAYLCLIPSPEKPGKLKRYVTQDWVDLLDWEMVSWWFQDDGCKQANSIVISTHSFSLEEVQRLADWLTAHDCPSCPKKVRKGVKEYWTLFVPTESAKIFKEKVLPFMHPSLLYKLDFEERKAFKCMFCGKQFRRESSLTQVNPERPCCASPECRRERNRSRAEIQAKRIGFKPLYEKWKARMAADPEKKAETTKRSNQRQAERFSDPEYRAHWNAWKKEYRAKRKAEGRSEKVGMTLTCQFCSQDFTNTKEHNVCRDSPIIYCSAPECLEKHRVAFRRIRQDRQNAKRSAMK